VRDERFRKNSDYLLKHLLGFIFVNFNIWHLICNNFNLNFMYDTVCLYVCVCAFSLRRESPDMILGDKIPHFWCGSITVMILVRTDHPCLRVEHHSWYQSITCIIHHVRSYFQKIYGEDMLGCPCKNYSSLNRWQANMNLLFTYTLCNLLSVTMHLWHGNILSPGDASFGPIPSRRGLRVDSPYRAVGAACPSCDESQPHT
jgi:hypothetical protein